MKLVLLVLLSFLFEQSLSAACASLVRGQLTLDVQSCSSVQSEQVFGTAEPKYNFIRDLPPAQRKAFLDSYRGLLVKGKVARSLAVRNGLSPEQGALAGESITAFIPPQLMSCDAVNGKRLQAIMDETCCEGGGEVPCLLGASYVLRKPEVIGGANSKAGNLDSHATRQRPEFRQAQVFLTRKDYKQAVIALEKLHKANQLDVQGSFLLAATYRELDKCPLALPLLESIYRRFEKNDYWSDDETYIRRGTLLMARCLSMLERPGEAVMVLQSFLVEPQRFRKEINDSFSHADFGYIQTSKPYLDYREIAVKALAKP
ncbi:MAG: hypothetical protein NTX25_19240 [Proteobacteria bacterium]|nr:hypothetical protein [Pseudomonadota bacterium]